MFGCDSFVSYVLTYLMSMAMPHPSVGLDVKTLQPILEFNYVLEYVRTCNDDSKFVFGLLNKKINLPWV